MGLGWRNTATPSDSGAKELSEDGDLRSWEGAQGFKAEGEFLPAEQERRWCGYFRWASGQLGHWAWLAGVVAQQRCIPEHGKSTTWT